MQLGVEKPDLKGLPIVIDNKKNLASVLLASPIFKKIAKKKNFIKIIYYSICLFSFFFFDFLMAEFGTKVFLLIIQLWKKNITHIHHFQQKKSFFDKSLQKIITCRLQLEAT
jgi:hypothetical protein